MKTIKQLAQEALDVQDACNLSGVVHSFARSLGALRDALAANGDRVSTSAINAHPIAKVWADKIAHLTQTQSGAFGDIHHAYGVVHELANAPDPIDRGPAHGCAAYITYNPGESA